MVTRRLSSDRSPKNENGEPVSRRTPRLLTVLTPWRSVVLDHHRFAPQERCGYAFVKWLSGGIELYLLLLAYFLLTPPPRGLQDNPCRPTAVRRTVRHSRAACPRETGERESTPNATGSPSPFSRGRAYTRVTTKRVARTWSLSPQPVRRLTDSFIKKPPRSIGALLALRQPRLTLPSGLPRIGGQNVHLGEGLSWSSLG